MIKLFLLLSLFGFVYGIVYGAVTYAFTAVDTTPEQAWQAPLENSPLSRIDR